MPFSAQGVIESLINQVKEVDKVSVYPWCKRLPRSEMANSHHGMVDANFMHLLKTPKMHTTKNEPITAMEMQMKEELANREQPPKFNERETVPIMILSGKWQK